MASPSRIWVPNRKRLAAIPRMLRRAFSRSTTPRNALAHDWIEAIETERLIDAHEWAEAHDVKLATPYRIAVTPEVLEAVETVPFTEVGEGCAERRMLRLIAQVQRLVSYTLGKPERPRAGAPVAIDFASPLRTRAHEKAFRALRLYVDPTQRYVTVGLPHELHAHPGLLPG